MMSEFESTTCKVLGVLLFCILMILYLQLIGCTSSSNGAFNHASPDFYQESKHMEFPVKDTRDYIHYYKQPVIIHHGEMLTLYCRRDKQWEKIRAKYDYNRDTYNYHIIRMRKQ